MSRLHRALQDGPRWVGFPGAYYAEDLAQKSVGYLIVVNMADKRVEKIYLFEGEPIKDVRSALSNYHGPAFDVLIGSARNTDDLELTVSEHIYVWDEREVQPEDLPIPNISTSS